MREMLTTRDSLPSLHLPPWMKLLGEALSSTQELENFLGHPVAQTPYPLLLPRPLAQKIKEAGPESPLWKEFIPHAQENIHREDELVDPIGDQRYAKGGGIIHRYPNRILFSPTPSCPIQCRYCFRKNELHGKRTSPFENHSSSTHQEKLTSYLKEHPEVEEVIFTGGDPLMITTRKLKNYLQALSLIPTLKIIRFHTRTPVILPERIDDELLELFRFFSSRFEVMILVIHTNHISEWNPLFLSKMKKLRSLPLLLLSQSVLLKGVNDKIEDLFLLFKFLTFHGIKPYYLHHPDPAKGTSHFRLSLLEGQKLYRQLRQKLSGPMLPHYIVEIPEGEGKELAIEIPSNRMS